MHRVISRHLGVIIRIRETNCNLDEIRKTANKSTGKVPIFKISFKKETRDDLLRAKTFKLCVIWNKIKMDACYEFVACDRKNRKY